MFFSCQSQCLFELKAGYGGVDNWKSLLMNTKLILDSTSEHVRKEPKRVKGHAVSPCAESVARFTISK